MRKQLVFLATLGAGTFSVMLPSTAMAANYTVCMKWDIETVDSGHPIIGGPSDGLTEDKYTSCDDGCAARARGADLLVTNASAQQQLLQLSSSGCTTFTDNSGSAVFGLQLYANSTNSNGTNVRIHDDPWDEIDDGGDFWPGGTRSYATSATLSSGATTTVTVGGGSILATAAAVSGYTLYRYPDGVSSAQIHIGFNPASCTTAGTLFPDNTDSSIISWNQTSNGRHNIAIGSCATGGTPRARRKFVVAHEIGHTLLRLYAANDRKEEEKDSSRLTASNCVNGSSYGMGSLEYSSVTITEALPHFISAKVWNNKYSTGAFRWWSDDQGDNPTFDVAHDLERFGPGVTDEVTPAWPTSQFNDAGGRAENICDNQNNVPAPLLYTDLSDSGTCEDQLRHFWDWYTGPSGNWCTNGEQPTKLDFLDLYVEWRDLYPTNSNTDEKLEVAAHQLGLPSCLALYSSPNDEYNFYQEHNGTDR